ncbi:unnamed protein product [Ceratitis capitata]|uniref:Gustatory receptor n=1 Tax=Ceratitis capitata TaxID=7213 RepID=A0A811UGS3_CERCA|nr:unnamed protein product [Ceratitis capitata]
MKNYQPLDLCPMFFRRCSNPSGCLYEIGPPTRRVTRITRLMLLAKAVMNIVHVYIYLSSTILKILFLRSQTDGITNMLDVTFCMICDITITWTCVCNTTIIMEIINRFLKVDRLLKQYADSPAERPTSTNIFNRYLFFIYAYIFSLIISYLKRTYDLVSLYFWIYILFYQLENAISCAFVVFISALMHLLAERFRYINQLIAQYNRREIVRSSEYYTHGRLMPTSDFDGKTTNRNEATLQLFATNSAIIYGLYVDLLDILKMINNYAGLGLLAYLLYACYGLLSCAYNSLLFNWSPGEDLLYGLELLVAASLCEYIDNIGK